MKKTVIFDPDGVGICNGKYFGMPFEKGNSKIVLVSIPWDVTVSYGDGTRFAPEAILQASPQLDFFDPENEGAWQRGIATEPVDPQILPMAEKMRKVATRVIEDLENEVFTQDTKQNIEQVNKASLWLNDKVYSKCKSLLAEDKIVGLVGGDHSTPFGAIKAVGEKYPGVGILHIDAHMDLRKAYEGFEFSHASIMYNVATKCEGVARFVQVGVRDFCSSEWEFASEDERFSVWTDSRLQNAIFDGENFGALVQKIIAPLPSKVYVSFDIDGLDPSLCPSTGTPVAGGLSFAQARRLLRDIVASGREIVGFDLNEVGREEYDANVGARMLYFLSCL